MTTLLRTAILLALLAIAIMFYTIGFSTGAVLAFTLGILFELAFWFGLFKVTRNPDSSSKSQSNTPL